MATSSSLTPSLGRRPFRATYIWNTLINHLRENVNVKQRRNVKKVSEESFCGANAVDVLYNFVRRNPNQFTSSTITRENIVRLCQSFIDNGVLEEVGSSNTTSKLVKFDDATSSLYVFTEEYSLHTDVTEANSLKGRQVLREIDGEIRNSLDHISISTEKNSEKVENSDDTNKAKEILVPKRGSRSRFPSFSGISATSLKETLLQTLNKADTDDMSETRGRRHLKRSSSFVGLVGKRSSSTSSLNQATGSTFLDVDSAENKNKKSDSVRGPKLRFSQRLSFRKKSFRRSGHAEDDANQFVITNSSVVNDSTAAATKEAKCGSIDKEKKRKMSPQEIMHLRRECIRVRLLQILDISFVDDLITSPTDTKCDGDVNSSSFSFGVQYSEVVAAYNSEDSWIASALSLLQTIPNSYEILCEHSKESHHLKKIKLYFAITKYFQSLSKPIVDKSFQDIVESLVQMLTTKPVAQSLEAVQLFLHLFPDSKLCQLRLLFSFLHHVINNEDISLTRRNNNKTLVLETFWPILFSSVEKNSGCDVTTGCGGLVLFMIKHSHQVFKLPVEVATAVNRKRVLLESGEVDSPTLLTDSTFCKMITSKEYDEQKVEATNKHVTDLAQFMSQSLSARRKKEFLKKLKAAHPSVYEQTRGPLKASHVNVASLQPPATDGAIRRSNKARKQVYV